MPSRRICSVALLCFLLPLSIRAQGPRIGLALSGGGAKGLLREVDGNRSPDEVFADITRVLGA